MKIVLERGCARWRERHQGELCRLSSGNFLGRAGGNCPFAQRRYLFVFYALPVAGVNRGGEVKTLRGRMS